MSAEQTSFIHIADRHPSVRELPATEQPINRLRDYGPGSLSTIEILACILQTPDALHQATNLLVRFGTLAGIVKATESQLKEIPGVGPVLAARVKAACELGQRFALESTDPHMQIRSPGDAAVILLPEMSMLEREHFVVVFLDTRNRILSHKTLYTGTINSSIVRIGEVFQEAIRRNVTSIIVAHNHPSGDPNPSPEDVSLTRRLVEAGKLIEVDVLDHLVIGNQKYISMRERGLGFESV